MIVSKELLKKLESIYMPIYAHGNCDPHNEFKKALNYEFNASIDRNDAKTIYYVAVYNLNFGKVNESVRLDQRVSEIFSKLVGENV